VALVVGGAPAHEVPTGELVADSVFPTALEDVGTEQLDGKGAGDRDPDAIRGELDGLADAEGVGPLGGPSDVDSAFGHPPALGALALDSLRCGHVGSVASVRLVGSCVNDPRHRLSNATLVNEGGSASPPSAQPRRRTQALPRHRGT